ncbi:TadE/TadG family type IV pilus assembly protein [Phyllobacterium chamaecytisi]|uniref:TadE/TadG family type IV pilus assembly protein n=1 Tax=Phyllobacterium chamaecytisi TaxID=2876082 RepID=UPI001CCF61F3|nr:pilus assembly protein [Phyllobacterium sp. KW56]
MCGNLPFKDNEKGGTAVEFALVAPLLMMFLLGIIVFGWSMNAMSSVRYALEETSRALQLKKSLSQNEIEALVRDHVSQLGLQNITVSLTIDPPDGGFKMAHVTATYNFVVDLPLINQYPVSYNASITVPMTAP